jgi:hypothetical protein
MSFSHEITISNIPADKVQKCKIAGQAEVVDSLVKRVVLLNRSTMELVAARNVNDDNSWEMFAPDQGDGNHLLIGLDEGGNFNVDAFDRVSLGTTTFTADPVEFQKVLSNADAYYVEEIVNYRFPERLSKLEGEFDKDTPLEGIYYVQEVEATVVNFGEGHFEDEAGTVLDLSSSDYSFLKEEVFFNISDNVFKIREVKTDNVTVIVEGNANFTERVLVDSYTPVLDKDLEVCGVGENVVRFLPTDRAFSVFKDTSPVNLNINFKTNVKISTGNEDIVLTGNIINVPEDYATVQAAHDAANDGDILLIAPGTYTEWVKVSKGVHIFGTGKSPLDVKIYYGAGSSYALEYTTAFATNQSVLYLGNLTVDHNDAAERVLAFNNPQSTEKYTIEVIDVYIDATYSYGRGIHGIRSNSNLTVNFRRCYLNSAEYIVWDYDTGKINFYETQMNMNLNCYSCSASFGETDYVTTETEGYGLYNDFNINKHLPRFVYEQANPKYFTISKDSVNSYAENIKIGIDLSKIPEVFDEITDYTELTVVFQDSEFLDIEVERFDKPNKKGLIWFNLPYVSDIEDTHFALLYPYSKSNIFMTETSHEHDLYQDNLFVYHMTDLPEGADAVRDSSPNANHATPSGMTAANQGIGLLGSPEYNFTGSEIINAGNIIPEKIREGTIEVVFKTTSNKAHLLSQDSSSVGDRDVNLSIGKPTGVVNDVADGYLNFEVNGSQTGETRNIVSSIPVNDSQYHYLGISFYNNVFGMVIDENKNIPFDYEYKAFGNTDNFIVGYDGTDYLSGTIKDILISDKFIDAEALNLINKSMQDSLIEYNSSSGVTYSEDTQADFQTGDLYDVEADAGDYLKLTNRNILNFDGVDNFVDCGSVSFVVKTVEFWVNAGEISNSNQAGAIISFSDDQDEIVLGEISSHVSSETITWQYHSEKNYERTAITKSFASGWHHVCFVWDENINEYKILVDGNFYQTSHSDQGKLTLRNASYIKIGVRNFGNSGYLNGILSGIRIWDIARTQQEIKDNMYTTLTGSETGLVAYYKFDEGTGTTAIDSAGNNNGTIYGATWKNEYVHGSRISPQINLASVGSAGNSTISWTEVLNNQTLILETRVSLDDGVTWTDWKPCTKDSAIPDLTSGTNVSNGLLECRQILSTNDSTVTPELHSLNINVEGTGSSLTAKFTSDKELNNVPLCLKLSNSSGMTGLDITNILTNSSNLTVLQSVNNLKIERSFWELNTYAELWTLFPQIKKGENTFLITQDDEANPNIGGIGSTQGQEVFQDFKAVYHLNQDPAAIKDSTGNNPDATAYNITTTDVSKDGTILDGINKYINLGQITTKEFNHGQVHLSFKTTDTNKPVLTKSTDAFNISSTGTLDVSLNETISSEITLNDGALQTTSFSFDKHKTDLIISGTDELFWGSFGSNGLADILIGGNYLGANFEGSIVDLRFNTKSRHLDDLVLQGKMWKENLFQGLNLPQIIPAFSFDEGNTFKTYVNDTWKAVATKDEAVHLVTGDSDWYYIDDTGTWNKAFQNNSNFALKQAMQFQENMCYVVTIRNLTSAEWTSTGGMTAEGNLQIAFCYNSKIDNLYPSITDVNVDDKIILSCQSYDLEPYSTKITGSKIEWEARILEGVNFDSAQIEVYSIVTGGTWQQCTRNESIPDIVPEMDTTGKELQFKIVVPKDIPESVIINLIPKIQ